MNLILLRIASLTLMSLLVGCAATVQKGDHPTDAPAASSAHATSVAPMPNVAVPTSARQRMVINLSGSKTSTDSKDWSAFKREWQDIFNEQFGKAGIRLEWQEGDLKPLGERGTLLSVQVNDFRFVGVGARVMFGVFTGNAFINARLRFANLENGDSFGEQVYNTSSSAGHGVFAAVTPKQIYAIADEVIAEMRAGTAGSK